MTNDFSVYEFEFESDLSQAEMDQAWLDFMGKRNIEQDSEGWDSDFYYQFRLLPDGRFRMSHTLDEYQYSMHPHYDELLMFIQKVIKPNTFTLIQLDDNVTEGTIITSKGRYPVEYVPQIDGKSPQEWFDNGGEVAHVLKKSRKGG